MKRLYRLNRSAKHDSRRRGAAIVEFAVTAPVFLVLTLGTVELGYALNASNTLYGALREGGRLASQDFTPLLDPGDNANAKVIADIKAMLTASRIPGTDVDIAIVYADGAEAGSPFDLMNNNNYLRLFKITAEVPYESVSLIPGNFLGGEKLRADITFRMGRVQQVE